jgi:hypothetical protein
MLGNCWTGFDEILYEMYTIGGHPNPTLFSIICNNTMADMQTSEWEQHKHYLM